MHAICLNNISHGRGINYVFKLNFSRLLYENLMTSNDTGTFNEY